MTRKCYWKEESIIVALANWIGQLHIFLWLLKCWRPRRQMSGVFYQAGFAATQSSHQVRVSRRQLIWIDDVWSNWLGWGTQVEGDCVRTPIRPPDQVSTTIWLAPPNPTTSPTADSCHNEPTLKFKQLKGYSCKTTALPLKRLNC